MRDVHDHQHQLEEHTDPDDRDLLVLPEPLQQDEKWNEGGGGHVANGIDRRVEEGTPGFERSHQQTERDGPPGPAEGTPDDPERASPPAAFANQSYPLLRP